MFSYKNNWNYLVSLSKYLYLEIISVNCSSMVLGVSVIWRYLFGEISLNLCVYMCVRVLYAMRSCRSIPSFEKQTSITPHKSSSVTLAVKFGQTSYKRPIILYTTTICITPVYCRKRVQDRIRIDDETRTNGVQDLIGAYIYIYTHTT